MPTDPTARRQNQLAQIFQRAASSRNWAIASEEQARAKIDQQLAWIHRAHEMSESGIASRKRELLALGFDAQLVDQVMAELDNRLRSERVSGSDLPSVGQQFAVLLLRKYAEQQDA